MTNLTKHAAAVLRTERGTFPTDRTEGETEETAPPPPPPTALLAPAPRTHAAYDAPLNSAALASCELRRPPPASRTRALNDTAFTALYRPSVEVIEWQLEPNDNGDHFSCYEGEDAYHCLAAIGPVVYGQVVMTHEMFISVRSPKRRGDSSSQIRKFYLRWSEQA